MIQLIILTISQTHSTSDSPFVDFFFPVQFLLGLIAFHLYQGIGMLSLLLYTDQLIRIYPLLTKK